MQYFFILLILLIVEFLYFKVASHYNIIDKPNHRSSHTEITLRGGGVIYWFAALIYFVQHGQENYLFFTGLTVVSVISFWDDIQSLSNRLRLSAQFFAISLVFYQLGMFLILPIYTIIIGYVFFVGVINAYNFMDGINGITGLYTVVVMGFLWYVNEYVILFTDSTFIVYPILASVVFLFFNFRKKAKCFAGDVGSIAIAFWVVFLLLQLMLVTNSIVWLLFLAVYGIDTVFTILHRIYLKENIFEAHRWHFYQVLSNGCKLQQRLVAVLYAVLQLFVSVVVVFGYGTLSEIWVFILILMPLLLLYSIKFYLLKKINY